jgi:hypothetical protein
MGEEQQQDSRAGGTGHSRLTIYLITGLVNGLTIVGSFADIISLYALDGRILLGLAGFGVILLAITMTIGRYSLTRRGMTVVGAILVLSVAGACVAVSLAKSDERADKPIATSPGTQPAPAPAGGPPAISVTPSAPGTTVVSPGPGAGTGDDEGIRVDTPPGGLVGIPPYTTGPARQTIRPSPTKSKRPATSPAAGTGDGPKPSVGIFFPQSGDNVRQARNSNGYLANLSAGDEIWALVRAVSGGPYRPQGPCPHDAGTWSCANVPYPSADDCQLRVVVVDAAGSRTLAAHREDGVTGVADPAASADVLVKC